MISSFASSAGSSDSFVSSFNVSLVSLGSSPLITSYTKFNSNLNSKRNSCCHDSFSKISPKETSFPSLSVNIEFLKTKYNLLINSDIKIRKFVLPIQNKKVLAALLYIDGMVNEETITNSVLQPLLLKNLIMFISQNSSIFN